MSAKIRVIWPSRGICGVTITQVRSTFLLSFLSHLQESSTGAGFLPSTKLGTEISFFSFFWCFLVCVFWDCELRKLRVSPCECCFGFFVCYFLPCPPHGCPRLKGSSHVFWWFFFVWVRGVNINWRWSRRQILNELMKRHTRIQLCILKRRRDSLQTCPNFDILWYFLKFFSVI